MILLLSRSEGESTTELVMDWLEYLGANFCRINGNDLERGHFEWSLGAENSKVYFSIDGITLDFDSINVVWYRRWSAKNQELKFNSDFYLKNNYITHRRSEFLTISKTFFGLLANKKWISRPKNFGKRGLNKLETLEIAFELGFKIPDSIVTTRKIIVEHFFKKNNCQIISKPLSEPLHIEYKGKGYSTYTTLLTKKEIDTLPKSFFPTFFQEFVRKEIEIRVFYWFGICYSMAIFSTLDTQTAVDFRRYNNEKPNRYVPYRLPERISNLVDQLMNKLEYSNGSIDIIKSVDGEYYFLEVNPVGQFGMVSYPCNYNLELIVAQKLVELDEK